MNLNRHKKITDYVELFFEEIPYSETTFQAKERIADCLEQEYGQLLEENPAAAFDKLTTTYHSLELMAKRAGYTKDEAETWRSCREIISFDQFKRQFKKEKRRRIISLLPCIFAAVYLINCVLNFHVIYLILMALFIFIEVALLYKMKAKNEAEEFYSVDCYEQFKSLYDKYTKKVFNSLFIGFLCIYGFVTVMVQLSINSKSYELLEYINGNLLYMEIVVFLLLKNLLINQWIVKKTKLERAKTYQKYVKREFLAAVIYFSAAFLLFYILEKAVWTNSSSMASILYGLYALLFNFTIRRKLTYKNHVFNKRKVSICAAIVVAGSFYSRMREDTWYTQPYINSVPNLAQNNCEIHYEEETGIYTIRNNKEEFKILQLTDIHLGGSLYCYDKDLKALKAVYQLIDYSKPDFVIVTGDLTFPAGIYSFSFNNSAGVMQFASFMRNLGVPWAFTYGNHDTESYAVTSKEDLNELYQSLSYKTSRTLLYPYKQPDIMGRNNQIIEVRNADGSLNQALVLIDSNAYTDEGLNKYDYIHDDQVDWYKANIARLEQEEQRAISSLVFFHIPLQQYRTAYELYEKGSSEVTYYFGANDEKMINKICASDYPSKIFDAALEMKSTKGFFCGHDHYNNMSLEYKGIRLTYGMSIDYLAMPGIANDTKQRGATLITLQNDSTFEIEQIRLTDIEQFY